MKGAAAARALKSLFCTSNPGSNATPAGASARQLKMEDAQEPVPNAPKHPAKASPPGIEIKVSSGSTHSSASGPAHEDHDEVHPLVLFAKEKIEQDAENQTLAVGELCQIMDFFVEASLKSPTPKFELPAELQIFEGDDLPCTATHFITGMLEISDMSPTCVVVAFLYLTRIKKAYPQLAVTSTNCQRLLLTAVMVATKFCEDENFNNKHWGEVGELPLAEVNALEIRFLNLLNMTCIVRQGQYDNVLESISTLARSLSLSRRAARC